MIVVLLAFVLCWFGKSKVGRYIGRDSGPDWTGEKDQGGVIFFVCRCFSRLRFGFC